MGGTLYHEEVAYSDQLLLPDLETAAVVPWREATARWICDSTWADGTPLEALPPGVVKSGVISCRCRRETNPLVACLALNSAPPWVDYFHGSR